MTVSVTTRVVVPLPLVRLVNVTVLEKTPAAKLLALALIVTVTLVLIPAANVPLVADRLSQFSLALADQSNAALPLLVNVYTWLDGLNGPPTGPLEAKSEGAVMQTFHEPLLSPKM